MLKNTSQHYGLIARFLHWTMALLAFGLFASGLYMTSLGYYDALYHTLPWWHKSIGLTTLLLFLFRLIWKLASLSPAPLDSHTKLEKTLAKFVHVSIYWLFLFIFVSGYLISTAKGKGIEFFGLFDVPALLTPFENQADIAGQIHFILASTLIALVVLHAAGAIKHHFIDKDHTLIRMIRG